MPATYEPIATTTLGSGNTTINFSSIPNTYTDLRLITVALTSSSTADSSIQFNGDTNTNYSYVTLYGANNAIATSRNSNWMQIPLDAGVATVSTIPSFRTVDIFNYTGSNFKTVLCSTYSDKNSLGSSAVFIRCGLWRSTSAITSVTFFANGNMAAGTIATLYGIKNA